MRAAVSTTGRTRCGRPAVTSVTRAATDTEATTLPKGSRIGAAMEHMPGSTPPTDTA